MSILEAALWVQSTWFFTELRLSSYVYPVVLSAHVAGIALFGGTVLASDLRLLGIAMRTRQVSDVIDQLRIPKRIGFLVVATCGLLLLGSKAEEYYYNVFFHVKLLLLALVAVHALVFRRGVYGNSAELDRAPRLPAQAKLAASLSLLLWLGLIIAGRGIGYIEAPFNIHARTERPAAPNHAAVPNHAAIPNHVAIPSAAVPNHAGG
jgi:hypothetical protein